MKIDNKLDAIILYLQVLSLEAPELCEVIYQHMVNIGLIKNNKLTFPVSKELEKRLFLYLDSNIWKKFKKCLE